MLKVLIVDDELLVRNYLRTLIDWEAMGYEICGEATNGMTATRMIEELSPDIVIFDINMPVMDGVALADYISKNHSSIKMFVLSSYDDFNYVRETLRNGAIDYILKDQMDSSELARILGKINNLKAEEERKTKELDTVKKELAAVGSMAKEQYLKELLISSKDFNEDGSGYFDVLNINSNERFIIICAMQISNYFVRTSKYSDMEREQLIRSVKNMCGQVSSGDDKVLTVYMDEGRFAFLFIPYSCISEAEAYSRLDQYIRRLTDSLNRYLNMQVLWGTSCPCKEVGNISHLYKNACQVLKANYKKKSLGKEKSNTSPGELKTVTLTIRHEKELLTGIEIGDIEKVNSTIEDIFLSLKESNDLSTSLQLILNEMITIAIKTADEHKLDSRNIYDSISGYEQERTFTNVDIGKVKEYIKVIFSRLIKESSNLCHCGNFSEYTRKAIEYINENYKKDISLNQVSEMLGLSSAYFSRLFSKETNRGFVEYLNNIRVSRAIKIMEAGERNLKIVYSESGFNSYNYFFKVFKETVGSTPLHYIKNK